MIIVESGIPGVFFGAFAAHELQKILQVSRYEISTGALYANCDKI